VQTAISHFKFNQILNFGLSITIMVGSNYGIGKHTLAISQSDLVPMLKVPTHLHPLYSSLNFLSASGLRASYTQLLWVWSKCRCYGSIFVSTLGDKCAGLSTSSCSSMSDYPFPASSAHWQVVAPHLYSGPIQHREIAWLWLHSRSFTKSMAS